jgi:hypothetical protein
MKGTHELFISWLETNSNIHVELGTHAKYGAKGVGTVKFQLDSRGSLEVENFLYVPNIRRNFLLVSTLEDKGYISLFHNGQVFMISEGIIPNRAINIGVIEGKVHRF